MKKISRFQHRSFSFYSLRAWGIYALFLLFLGANLAAQSPAPHIRIEVKPREEFMFGLIGSDPSKKAVVETDEGKEITIQLSDSQEIPTIVKCSSERGFVRIFGSYHTLGCPENGAKITALDCSNYPSLRALYCHKNNISSLNLKGCTELQLLSFANNPIKQIDLGDCRSLVEMACFQCELSELNLTPLISLRRINCAVNKIASLDFSPLPQIEQIWVGENMLKELKLPQEMPHLSVLSCYTNQLKTITIGQAPLLEELDANSNLLEKIEVNHLGELKDLDLSYNQLPSLFVDKLLKLEYLRVNENPIREIRIASPYLQTLNISQTKLAAIDLTQQTELIDLFIAGTQIEALDLKNNKKIEKILADGNHLSVCALDELFLSLHNQPGEKKIYVKENPECNLSKTEIARKKGWTVDIEGDGTGCPKTAIEAPSHPLSWKICGRTLFIDGSEHPFDLFDLSGQLLHRTEGAHPQTHITLAPGGYLLVSLQEEIKIWIQ